MILSFQSKPLRLLYEKGDPSKLPADHLARITTVLTRLDAVKRPEEMNTPGSDYHQLRASGKGSIRSKSKLTGKSFFASPVKTLWMLTTSITIDYQFLSKRTAPCQCSIPRTPAT